MQNVARITMIILAVVQVLLTTVTALTGSFADGGEWWERLVLVLLHPMAAVLLIILVVKSQPSRTLVITTTVLLLFNITADVLLSLAIQSGITRGDWWLPLIFSVIPVIALLYCRMLIRRL